MEDYTQERSNKLSITNIVAGLISTAIITIGTMLLVSINEIKQEVAVLQNMILERDKLDDKTDYTLKDHELRLRIIEQDKIIHQQSKELQR